MMEAAFAGFAALPAPGQSSGDDPWKLLNVPYDVTEEQLSTAYRTLAKKYHTDNKETGDALMFTRIRHAHDMIANTLRKP